MPSASTQLQQLTAEPRSTWPLTFCRAAKADDVCAEAMHPVLSAASFVSGAIRLRYLMCIYIIRIYIYIITVIYITMQYYIHIYIHFVSYIRSMLGIPLNPMSSSCSPCRHAPRQVCNAELKPTTSFRSSLMSAPCSSCKLFRQSLCLLF